jgi:hypothetical protein
VIITGGDGERFQGWGLAIDAIDQYLIFLGMLQILQPENLKSVAKQHF